MEVESALVAHEMVAEAAVVGRPDDTTGEAVVAFVVPKRNRPEGEEAQAIAKQLRDWVGQGNRPDRQAQGHPLRRQPAQDPFGKIMRRLLRVVAKGEEVTQDVSTLENPAILEQLAKLLDRAASARRTPHLAMRRQAHNAVSSGLAGPVARPARAFSAAHGFSREYWK